MLSGTEKLIRIVAALRDPKSGCPWDLEQNHETLLPYFFEELHEFADAFKKLGPDSPKTWEELGDVLYQIVLHAQLASENSRTSFDEIAGRTAEKLVLRHPHVFEPGYPKYETAAEVNRAWEAIKAHGRLKESAGHSGGPADRPGHLGQASGLDGGGQAAGAVGPAALSVLDVPSTLPSLQRSARMGEKAASFGFDWLDIDELFTKIEEEIVELKEARDVPEAAQEELGDLLFVLAQYARKRGWNAEAILARSNDKFARRFQATEQYLLAQGKRLDESDRPSMDAAWDAIKKQELGG